MKERSIVPGLHAEWSSFIVLTKWVVPNVPSCGMVQCNQAFQGTEEMNLTWATTGMWTPVAVILNSRIMYRNWRAITVTRGPNGHVPNTTLRRSGSSMVGMGIVPSEVTRS